MNRKHIQPVEKVRPESALFHKLVKIFVGGGDTPKINMDGTRTTHTGNFVLLKHAQQIALRLQADVADFVEKNCATIRHLKASFLAVLRSGEGPFFVTKQLAFQQRFSKRTAVNHHQWVIVPRAGRMNRAGAQLLCPCRFRR